MSDQPIRTMFVVQYDTPLIQQTQEFGTLAAADNFADHITSTPLGRVHNAMVLSVGTQIIGQYHRKEED